MSVHTVTAQNVSTGSVANTFKSLLSIITANTAGHRARLRAIAIGGGGAAAQDVQVSLRLARSDNTTAGTSTGVTPQKKDSLSLATVITSGKNYSAEPTILTTVWEEGMNSRGSLYVRFPLDDCPICNRNESLVLQAAPGEATAVSLTVTLEFEEF